MSSNVVNQVAYLRTSREFPQEAQELQVELSKSYIDTANAVNVRTIGIFPSDRPAITGESWFVIQNQKQQSFRQVYTFTAAGNIAHNIDLTNIGGFTKIYGTFTDGTDWYPLPYVDVVNVTNQINVVVDATNIVITAGAGAPPSITRGYVVLEWLSFSRNMV